MNEEEKHKDKDKGFFCSKEQIDNESFLWIKERSETRLRELFQDPEIDWGKLK